jgi:hypothetical protein
MFEPALPQDNRAHGKRIFASDQVQISAKFLPESVGKRTFPRDASMYAQDAAPHTTRELHTWAETESRRRVVCPSELEFTRPGKSWMPVGGKGGHPIPQPPPSPRAANADNSPGRPTTSPRGGPPSDRLMSRPHRVELSPKLPLPKKEVDVNKLMERMEQNVKRRQAKLEANEKMREQQQPSPRAKSNRKDGNDDGNESTRSHPADMNEFHRRLVEEPLQQRERHLKALQDSLIHSHSKSPQRRLSSREQKVVSRRLHDEGVAHQKKTIAFVAKKYVDDVAPKFSSLSAEELQASAARLYHGDQ